MRTSKQNFKAILNFMITMLIVAGCDGTSSSNANTDSKLNGSWANGVQSGPNKVYITVLKLNNGNFEWTWDNDLQQRGVYDTKNGVLTVTVKNNYGNPQKLLGDYSSEYSISKDTLTWGSFKGGKE